MTSDSDCYSDQVAHLNVAYFTRVFTVLGLFERAIRESIPHDLVIKIKSGQEAVSPGSRNYDVWRSRFAREVASHEAKLILAFLYAHEMFFSKNQKHFFDDFSHLIGPERIDQVREVFPKVDQTTICAIMQGAVSTSTICNRLDDLIDVGLIDRNKVKAPHPKYLRITAKGIAVMERASVEGMEVLSHLFAPPPVGRERSQRIAEEARR